MAREIPSGPHLGALDGRGEFGECGMDSAPGCCCGPEFVVAAPVLDEGVSADQGVGGALGLDTAYGSKASLESPVVALDAVVRLLLGVM